MHGFKTTCFHCGFVWSDPIHLVESYENPNGGGMLLTYCPDHTPAMLVILKERDEYDKLFDNKIAH